MVLGATGSVYFGTASEWGDTGCQCNVNSVNIYCLHGVNHRIIQYSGHGTWYLVVLGQNRAVLVASMMSFQKI